MAGDGVQSRERRRGREGEGVGVDDAGRRTSTTTSLTPVTALPSSEAEIQIGLAKVAEPDVDAFMSYAAIVPEYCRLEGLLVKSIV